MTPLWSFGHDGAVERESLVRVVAGFAARTEREASARARFLSELDRLERPCSREADPVHVTASAIVVGSRGVVLHLHKRAHRWMQPGGHVEEGEGPAAAALREAEEETGLALRHPVEGPRLVHLDVHPAGDHVHLDLRYLLVADDDDPAPPAGESPDARWFALAEARQVADAALVDAFDRVPVGPAGIEPATQGL